MPVPSFLQRYGQAYPNPITSPGMPLLGNTSAPATADPTQPALAQGPMPITAASVQTLAAYDQAYTDANTAWQQIAQQLGKAQAALAQYQPANPQQAAVLGDPQQKALEAQVTSLQQAYDNVLAQKLKAANNRADAYATAQKSDDPNVRQLASANASRAQTEAQQADAQLKEWTDATPDRKAQVAAQQRLTGLQADTAQLNLDLARANAPADQEAARQRIQANTVAIQQAQGDLDVSKQTAGNRVALSGQAVTQGEQNITQGTLSLADLARQVRQAPSDEQAMTALQQALAQGGANLAATQAGTARSTALLPGELAQQQATLDSTQQQTQAGKQGTLYGLDDYIKTQKDAIAKGLLTPDQADQALVARISGTDVFSAAKASNDAMMARTNQQISQRADEINLASNKAGNLSSMANTGLSQFASMNSFAPPGSDVVGKGLVGWLGAAQSMQNQFQPPPREVAPPLPSMLQPFSGQPGQPAPAVTPGPAPATNAPVTINIGGQPAQPPMPQLQGNASGIGGNGTGVSSTPFQAQGQPALLDKMQPALPEHVQALFGRGGQF